MPQKMFLQNDGKHNALYVANIQTAKDFCIDQDVHDHVKMPYQRSSTLFDGYEQSI